jgi:PAS domain S-box-containing protein
MKSLFQIFSNIFSYREKDKVISALEYRIKELEDRYHVLTSNIAAAIIIRDMQDQTLFCSPYTEVLTGYSNDVLTENNNDFLEKIIDSEDLPRYQRAKKIGELGEEILVRFRIRHKTAISLWLESRFVPLMNEVGEVEATMSVTIDVTDSLNYQKQIEEQNRDLSDFSYMISHDLKAPVFTIKGMAGALLDDYSASLNDDAQKLINFIIEAASRLESLIGSVLEYTSLNNASYEEEDTQLTDIIENVIKDLRGQINESGAEIIVNDDFPIIRGNSLRLYQVFSNLLNNSIKYRDKTRQLSVQVELLAIDNEYASITIKDNGLGIPSNKLTDIFRPFHRAHARDIEGSGIGLACVKKIVEKIGGTIEVTSTEGIGSTFYLTLPVNKSRPQEIPKDLARLY